MTAQSVTDCIADLVTQSLIVADVDDDVVHYRLLDTTRPGAIGKLSDSAELEPTTRRHAEYFRTFVNRAAAERQTRPIAE